MVEKQDIWKSKHLLMQCLHTNLISKLWMSVSGELQNNNKALLQEQREYQSNDSDDSGLSGNDTHAENLMFGRVGKTDAINLFPAPQEMRVYWTAFKANVDPLTKVIHAPTLEKVVILSTQNVTAVPRNMLTLLFSIILVATVSMSEEECLNKIGQSRAKLIRRYAYATQRCLIRMGVLRTTDLIILTALLLYVLALRYDLDPQTVWNLSGILTRTAQRIGLHRDHDNALGSQLSPFEREMRRRVWKQLLILDWHSSELAGTTTLHTFFNTPFVNPKNLDDSDLDPNMRSEPQDREGATDMIFCCLRNEFGKFFILEHPRQHGMMYKGKPTTEMSLEEKINFIDETERQLELRYVRYCDPINPLHLMVTVVARTAMCGMRLRAHHPMHRTDESQNSPECRTKLFEWSLKALRYDNVTMSTPSLKKYTWHCRSFFQFQPFVYLLTHVRHAMVGPEIDEAWKELDKAYQNRPALIERRTGLHMAVAVLALKAWEAREAELRRLSVSFEVPDFIQKLRATTGESVASSQASAVPMASSGKKMPDKGAVRQQEWFSMSGQQNRPPGRMPGSMTPTGDRMNWTSSPMQSMLNARAEGGMFGSGGGNNFPISPSLMNQQPWASWANPRPNMPMESLANLETNMENWGMWEQLMQNPDMNMYSNDNSFNALDGLFMPLGG
jgi:Fungal specific transcription factor domain